MLNMASNRSLGISSIVTLCPILFLTSINEESMSIRSFKNLFFVFSIWDSPRVFLTAICLKVFPLLPNVVGVPLL